MLGENGRQSVGKNLLSDYCMFVKKAHSEKSSTKKDMQTLVEKKKVLILRSYRVEQHLISI